MSGNGWANLTENPGLKGPLLSKVENPVKLMKHLHFLNSRSLIFLE
jgi:hypothetical protein